MAQSKIITETVKPLYAVAGATEVAYEFARGYSIEAQKTATQRLNDVQTRVSKIEREPKALQNQAVSLVNARITELLVTEALERVPAEEAGPGEIVAIAGLPEVTIGETIADPNDPRPLPVTVVDEPSLSITIGINTSPLAGTEGDRLTASQIKARLDQELVGNVSLRVLPTSHDSSRFTCCTTSAMRSGIVPPLVSQRITVVAPAFAAAWSVWIA